MTRAVLTGRFTRIAPDAKLPPLKVAEPPTDAEVIRALKPGKGEVVRDDITIVKTRVGVRGEDGKVTWECAVYSKVKGDPPGRDRPRVATVTIRK